MNPDAITKSISFHCRACGKKRWGTIQDVVERGCVTVGWFYANSCRHTTPFALTGNGHMKALGIIEERRHMAGLGRAA